MFNPRIFREYDIRGVADRDLDDATVARIARAVGTLMQRRGKQRIGLGRDCRVSSDRIHSVMQRGLLESGLSLVDLGVVPTPLAYFSVHHFKLDGVVQITGSHNPPEDNGLKMMCGPDTLFGQDIQELRRLAEDNLSASATQSGELSHLDPLPPYVSHLRENLRLGPRRPKVAIDAGNGAGGPTAVAVFNALELDIVPLLCEMDGRFPVHHPDPTQPENLTLLMETMKKEQCDLGIAFDGDADRIGVVDPSGEIIWGDKLLTLFARNVLKAHPGASILGEVKCSQTLYDDIERHGGRPIIWKTGHSLIKKKMKEEHALLAGEMSGHIFFADRYYGYDDAIYAGCRIVEILSHEGQSVSQLLSDLPKTFSTPELRVPCPDDKKFIVVEHVVAHYTQTHQVLGIDGARINFPDGWGLVRASNTQPVLVLRFEAWNEAALQTIRNDVEGFLSQVTSGM